MKATEIRRMREKTGMSQADLARLLDVSPVSINRWELGRRTPDADTLKRIEAVLTGPEQGTPRKRPRAGRLVLVTGTGEGLLTDGSQVSVVDVLDLREPLTAKQKRRLAELAHLAQQDASPATVRVLSMALLNAVTR